MELGEFPAVSGMTPPQADFPVHPPEIQRPPQHRLIPHHSAQVGKKWVDYGYWSHPDLLSVDSMTLCFRLRQNECNNSTFCTGTASPTSGSGVLGCSPGLQPKADFGTGRQNNRLPWTSSTTGYCVGEQQSQCPSNVPIHPAQSNGHASGTLDGVRPAQPALSVHAPAGLQAARQRGLFCV